MTTNAQAARSTASAEADGAAVLLNPGQAAVFDRLKRELQGVWGRWGLFLLEYEHLSDQIAISNALNQITNRRIGKVLVDPARFPDWPALEAEIVRVARAVDLVQVMRLDQWLDPYDASGKTEQRLRAWNIRREGFARGCADAGLVLAQARRFEAAGGPRARSLALANQCASIRGA